MILSENEYRACGRCDKAKKEREAQAAKIQQARQNPPATKPVVFPRRAK